MADTLSQSHAGHAEIAAGEEARAAESAAKVLQVAKRLGASAAETRISHSVGLSVSVRLDSVDALEFHHSRQLTVAVYLGQCRGVARSTDDSDAAIQTTVEAALAIAREAEADPYAGLADVSLLATDFPDLDVYHPWALTPDEAIAQARACEQAGRANQGIVNSEGADVASGVGLTWYANSQGFSQGYKGSSHQRSCVLIARDDNGMQRDYWYDSNCRADRLQSAEAIGQEAARRVLARLGGRQPETGNYPVLFTPQVASGLLGHFVGAISGGNLYRKNSFLGDSLGEKIFPDWVTISERPRLSGYGSSLIFDGDGLPTREQTFVNEGQLSGYALGLYAARRLNMAPTGNGSGVHNLTITHSDQDYADLLKTMGDGVVITELMGRAINPVTGDYSRGASGFRVEGGEIAEPLEEFTLAGNLRDMFLGLQAAGTDIDTRSRVHCGSLLLDEMKIAGQS